MKKADVHVGSFYLAKVSDKLTVVKIIYESSRVLRGRYCRPDQTRACWHAVNVRTGRDVMIESAARLRGPASADQVRMAEFEANNPSRR